MPTDSDVSSSYNNNGGDCVLDDESRAAPAKQIGQRSTSESNYNRYSAPPDLYQVRLKKEGLF